MDGPAHLLARQLPNAPAEELADLAVADGILWVAGNALHRFREGEWETVYEESRILALEYVPERGELWFAGTQAFGVIDLETGTHSILPLIKGFIWDIVALDGRLWYFGGGGFGWIDLETRAPARFWAVDFSPRPFVMGPWSQRGEILLGSDSGLATVCPENGWVPVLSPAGDLTGQLITWAQPIPEGGYFLGSSSGAFQWDGMPEGTVSLVQTKSDQFTRGINNAHTWGRISAIVDFPIGIALWDGDQAAFTGVSNDKNGLLIGDIYKVGGHGPDVYLLGSHGIARVDLKDAARFFPGDEVLRGASLRYGFFHEGTAHVFPVDSAAPNDRLLRLSTDHWTVERLPAQPFSAGVDTGGHLSYTTLHHRKRFINGAWEQQNLGTAVRSVLWTPRGGFATDPDHLHALSSDGALRILTEAGPSDRLISWIDDSLLAVDHEHRPVIFRSRGAAWSRERLAGSLGNRAVSSAAVSGGAYVATEGGDLFFVDHRGARAIQLAPQWIARAVAAKDSEVCVILHHTESGKNALASWNAAGESSMWRVRQLNLIGKPGMVFTDERQIGLAGDGGILILPLAELERVSPPAPNFALIHGTAAVSGARLPYGTQRLSLTVTNAADLLPAYIQFRVNGGEWQALHGENATIQVGGHGSFRIETRMLLPNGVAIESPQSIHFRISPPWYQQPLVQLATLLFFALAITGGVRWRIASLNRMNTWLRETVDSKTRELEAATAARTNFLAGISHDVRNPLNGVLLLADSLAMDPPRDPLDNRLRELKDLGMVVDRMLGEVLDFSSIDHKSIPLNPSPVTLGEIIDAAVSQNQWILSRSLINLTTRLTSHERRFAIQADFSWLVQILSNLLINAVHYSQTERVEIGARILSEGEATAVVEFSVRDWGVGIDPSESELIFDRFVRGERGIESGHHGTGLGLAISREVMRAMGGELRLEKNDPHGAAFFITHRFDRASAKTLPDYARILADLRGKRVLVVEDLDYNRDAMERFFRDRGCIVHCEEAGPAGLQALVEGTFDLALLDWDLPGITGPQIARSFRRQCPQKETILLALTAYTDGAKQREAQRSGMNGYLAKPLTAQRLARTLAIIQGNPVAREMEEGSAIDNDRLAGAVQEQLRICQTLGDQLDFEGLRRAAHRLTTLALILGDEAMQRSCRELQVSASENDSERVRLGLRELRKWVHS
ncbi:MAG: response regulator [Opitutales bacterium]|nr:response regulator [Opitutales bacterium]